MGYIKKIEELLRKIGNVIIGWNILENIQIENDLGKYRIICLEDIIHELTHEKKKILLLFFNF